jgi:uncharacterized protein YndB with AHSA1/START domain
MPNALMNSIENQITIRAPRARVWKALTTPAQFAEWFRATISVEQFLAGERADLTSTYPGHEGAEFFFEVVEVSPEHRFVWRWSPADKQGREPFTTVVFELEEVSGGTLVKVTESGFEHISLERRAKAFESNTKGWQIQMQNLHDYAEQSQ